MEKVQYVCPKCGCNTYETDQFQATGGNFAKIFDVQNKKFITVSCTRCGYTELYRGNTTDGWNILDFLTNWRSWSRDPHSGAEEMCWKAVMDFLFDAVDVKRIEARHDPRNPNSGHVMKKCRMKYEGTLRSSDRNNQGICDACYYAQLKSER